ncbi:MAG TPA: hypothetical protein VFH94_28585 [Streptomyces sp.]|nr:hypothetical protein [Streptomyces sp.]
MKTGSIGWMRGFLTKWAVFVAIERRPDRAAALRRAEQVSSDPSATEQQVLTAQAEIGRVLGLAEQELDR